MASKTTSSNSLSNSREIAEVRVVFRRRWPQSKYKSAHVLISSRIYWKVVNKDANSKPQSFLDFRNADSLELVRLNNGKWDDVDEYVKVDNHNGRARITVSGRPHGGMRRNNALLVPNVRVEIIPSTSDQLEVWLNQIRSRIAPWSLLQEVVNDIASRAPLSGVEELEKAFGRLFTCCVDIEPSSMPTDVVEGKWNGNLGTLPERMEKLSIVDELVTHGTAAVETGASLSKLVACVERVAETAEFVADVSKCVSGVSTIFHLLALSAQGVSMCAEASRGRRVLPFALGRIVILLRYVLESMTAIMKPSRSVNELDKSFVFQVLKQTVGAMDMAETQLLRGRGSEFMNAEDVKEVEKRIEDLEPLVVIASNISRTCAVSEKINQLEEAREIWDDAPHHVRPSLSAFFSGRTRELDTLREKLEKWGSAVITQYGGVGKTELMIALAERAEQDDAVPGGVFWVRVDGGERDVIESLARLAEKLTRRKLDEEERRNGNLVVTALKQGLEKRKGRWLLCLDNADDSKVSGILNEVCGIAGGMRGDGWVVVSSRQGQPHIWSEMKREQKLVLVSLCTEDAMVALWRQTRKIKTSDADDDRVTKAIKKLERADVDEYQALEELCGDEGGCSLGGLPLALVQAGSYMARFECSFEKYRNMLKNACRIEDMQDIMRNTEEVKPIRESQRSIWTTWKISVGQLSGDAYEVLRVMAMLGPGGVGVPILEGILEGVAADAGRSVDWMFRNIVVGELIHGSSLICRYAGQGQEGDMYRMHRLVRLFVVSDMERGSAEWNEVYSLALVCVHEAVEFELENDGKSFRELPDVFGNNHLEIASHAIGLVHHHTLPAQGAEIRDVSKVEEIHRYSGGVMKFMGKVEEEVQVWERLVDVLEHRQAAKRSRSRELCFLDDGSEVKSSNSTSWSTFEGAPMRSGKLNDEALKHEQSLELLLAIQRRNKPYSDIGASLDNLGSVYGKLGKLDKALEKHEQSLQMKLAIHGPNTPHTATASSLNELGNVYRRLGKLDSALDKHEQSLQMFRAIHGSNKPHPDIATSLNNLGSVYNAQGKLVKALKKHEQGLQMFRAIHGPSKPHPDIASSLNNLGLVYRKLGKLDEALDKYEQSLDMHRAIHAPNKPHPAIATSLNNLGLVYRKLGRFDIALEKHKQSLEMFRVIHGPKKPHPDIAAVLDNLGSVYRKLGELNKALVKHKQSLDMHRTIHGRKKPHHAIATSLNNLGIVYEAQGKLDKATENYEESLEMQLIILGPDKPRPDIATALNKLGLLYVALGQPDRALAKHEMSLEMFRAIHGPTKPHPDIAISLWNIGFVYHEQKKLDQAAVFLEQSLGILRTVYARNSKHPHITELLLHLADVYEGQGRRDEALAIRERNAEAHKARDDEASNHASGN